jgi:phosphonate transport system substrate-binding protein
MKLLKITLNKKMVLSRKFSSPIHWTAIVLMLSTILGCSSGSSDSQNKADAITIVFPSRPESTDLQAKADKLVKVLAQESGLNLQAKIADETAAVEALTANQADVAFLGSRGALKAEKLTKARMYLAEVRPNYSGGHTYNSIFVVPKDSKISDLQSLKGKKIAFTSPTSGSGFIFPVSKLMTEKLIPNKEKLDGFFSQVSYGGNYAKALQALLRGQAEVAAVSEYAMFAPHLTPEESSKLKVIHKISGVPAHGVVIDDDIAEPVREKLIGAMLKLNEGSNNELLKSMYNSTSLVKVEHDQHLKPMVQALATIGMEP